MVESIVPAWPINCKHVFSITVNYKLVLRKVLSNGNLI